MNRPVWSVLTTCLVLAAGCASTPQYAKEDCPLYAELGPLVANPAGAIEHRLRVEVTLRVCPPEEGLAEVQRKRIELKHHLLALLSSKSTAELNDPLRVENLQKEIRTLVNQRVLKKGRVVEVYITQFELQ
jgi:flagellar basal body-associated protein FliL